MPYTEFSPPTSDINHSSRRHDPATDPLLASNHNNGNRMIPDDSSEQSANVRRRPHPGRILDRDADYFQSRGRWSGVELLPRGSGRRNRSSLSIGYHYHNRRRSRCCCGWIAVKRRLRQWLPRLWDDWFHTLAYQRTLTLMLILFVTYFLVVIFFGFIYLSVSILGAERQKQSDGSYVTTSFCDMDINDHMEALYFSLSTMTTIGYGVSDYYFGGCWTPLLLVLCQVCTAITFDAVAVGLLFTRLSRGRKRSKTIVCSNQSVVQVVQGTAYFMFRVAELRRFPLMNAFVRVYCIRHERIPKVYPSSAADRHTMARSVNSELTSASTHSQGTPIETTHFVTRSMKLLNHDETLTDSSNILMSLPQVLVHRMDDKSPLIPPSDWYDAQGHHHTFPQNKDNLLDVQSQIQEFWRDRGVEIVVLVEGVDELTGTTVQTRHSYCTSYNNIQMGEEDDEGDVAWNRAFVDCIFPYQPLDEDEDLEGNASNPVCTVDFERFHDTVPTPRDCLASPYVPY